MPRKKNASTKGINATPTRRSARQSASRKKSDENDVPEVFQELLIEAYHNNPEDFVPSPRPTKRRKVNDDHEEQPPAAEVVDLPSPIPSIPSSKVASLSPSPIPQRAPQVIFNNDFSDEDEDSDVSFEDVAISRQATPTSDIDDKKPEEKSLQLDLSGPVKDTASKQSMRVKTKPLTKAERLHRLNVHKWHLLCLMLHVQTVNRWCDDEGIQKTLKPLVPRKIINQLHLPESRTQAERKFSFDNALSEICHIWKLAFKITTRSMRKAHWREQLNMEIELDNAPDSFDFEDFQLAAKNCSGSRDLGAQLFCALFRSLAVDTRLVCSLQVLPFARSPTTNSTPQKSAPTYLTAGVQDFGTTSTPPRGRKKKIVDSPYPIWWIEVFSPSVTAWIPIDPLVRNTINKPRTGFEPPASDSLNAMSYVVAFEEDGTAKDITRRYSSYYNAKTRRSRVEVTKGGSEWLAPVMQHFAKPIIEKQDRDEIEDAALNRRVIQEGMPKNIQDFKDHPIYVLERHLHMNQVIEPKQECGKFSVGTGKNTRLENVYRRENLHTCRSSEGWYRRGRDVQPGQQPLKRAIPRKKRNASLPLEDEDDDEGEEGVPLYAEFQTGLYIPPPVVDGQVPRNGYGNLDVYVSSMIPAGGIHIRHPLAALAARNLKIDAAEAVTGFIFKGRQGTAVIDGVVVDARYTAAMLATIEVLEGQQEDEVSAQRDAIMMSVWKKMHAVLKVRQRIQEDYGEKAGINMNSRDDDSDDDPDYEHDGDEGGGFLPDVQTEATKESKAADAENLSMLRDRAPIVLPPLVVKQRPIVVRSPHNLLENHATLQRNITEDLFGDDDMDAGGFIPEVQGYDATNGGGFLVENDDVDGAGGGFIPEDAASQSGGFIPQLDDEQAGGFVHSDDTGGGSFHEDSPADGMSHTSSKTGPHPDPQSADALANPFKSDQSTSYPSRPIPQRRQSHTADQNEKNTEPKEPPPKMSTPTLHLPKHPLDARPMLSSQESNSSRRKGKQKTKGAAVTLQEEHTLNRDDDASMSDNSLPSHDPEEDDLEPQWVEDAFEDI